MITVHESIRWAENRITLHTDEINNALCVCVCALDVHTCRKLYSKRSTRQERRRRSPAECWEMRRKCWNIISCALCPPSTQEVNQCYWILLPFGVSRSQNTHTHTHTMRHVCKPDGKMVFKHNKHPPQFPHSGNQHFFHSTAFWRCEQHAHRVDLTPMNRCTDQVRSRVPKREENK